MLEKIDKLMATSFLLLGLGIAMVGVTNNPDTGLHTGVSQSLTDKADNTETISNNNNDRTPAFQLEQESNVKERDRQATSKPV
ncbi:MAG: hypothetical protein ABEJ83_03890 [Candidatus Nanohaloarchaea archaeon]